MHHARQGPGQDLGRGRHLLRRRQSCRRGVLRGVGLAVVEDLQELGARGPIDGGVVEFGQDGKAVLAQPLDHVDLPQRVAAIQSPADEAGDQLDQLVVRSGGGERRLAQMKLQVEVRVLDPERMVQLERYLDEPAAQRFHVRQAPGQLVPQGFVGRPVGIGRTGENPQAADVAERRPRLHVQETGVDPAQLLHELLPLFITPAHRLDPSRPTGSVSAPGQRRAGSRAWVPLRARRWSGCQPTLGLGRRTGSGAGVRAGHQAKARPVGRRGRRLSRAAVSSPSGRLQQAHAGRSVDHDGGAGEVAGRL